MLQMSVIVVAVGLLAMHMSMSMSTSTSMPSTHSCSSRCTSVNVNDIDRQSLPASTSTSTSTSAAASAFDAFDFSFVSVSARAQTSSGNFAAKFQWHADDAYADAEHVHRVIWPMLNTHHELTMSIDQETRIKEQMQMQLHQLQHEEQMNHAPASSAAAAAGTDVETPSQAHREHALEIELVDVENELNHLYGVIMSDASALTAQLKRRLAHLIERRNQLMQHKLDALKHDNAQAELKIKAAARIASEHRQARTRAHVRSLSRRQTHSTVARRRRGHAPVAAVAGH